jgi:hypothetical protein
MHHDTINPTRHYVRAFKSRRSVGGHASRISCRITSRTPPPAIPVRALAGTVAHSAPAPLTPSWCSPENGRPSPVHGADVGVQSVLM